MGAMDIAYHTSPSPSGFNYDRFTKPVIERRVSSSPSLDFGGFFPLVGVDHFTKPSACEADVILLLEGRKLLIVKHQRVERTQLKQEAPSGAVTSVERLDLIKDRLALSITQIAELFGVTRKAVYDWYEGAEPRPVTISRIEGLINVLDTVPADIDLKRLKSVWNIGLSGQSFREVLCNSNLDQASLQSVLTTKLNELYPRMVATTGSLRKTAPQLGEAHLAEFDRSADFS